MDAEKCEAGLDALGWYHEKQDAARGIGLGPEHDWSSHAADSFGAMALEAEALSRKQAGQARPVPRPTAGAWLGA